MIFRLKRKYLVTNKMVGDITLAGNITPGENITSDGDKALDDNKILHRAGG